MVASTQTPELQRLLSDRGRSAWSAVQAAVWVVGAAMMAALIWTPPVGLHAFWNVLIPVAPALLAVAPGLWRNVCPLGTTGLLPHRAGLSRRRTLPARWQGHLGLAGVIVLLVIVPLRHVVLDLNGPATALTIAALALVAVGGGLVFEWKSAWCSGLCPVHPVEKLYGSEPALSVPNAHCHPCERCVGPCPDSTPGVNPMTSNGHASRRIAGALMVGGFAGFIWGWFQVPDYAGSEGWAHLGSAFGLPFGGMFATLALYAVLRRALPSQHHIVLGRVFAAAAISCYYWYRLPALFGFGSFPGDGMLVDLRGPLPSWFPLVSRLTTTAFFVWWLVGRRGGERTWLERPPFASRVA